ncbi:MAG: hypothetical protein ACJ8DU_08295 [Microvirga sp.]
MSGANRRSREDWLRDIVLWGERLAGPHGYFATDEDIVWIAATVSVPRTVQAARALLNALQSDADGEP